MTQCRRPNGRFVRCPRKTTDLNRSLLSVTLTSFAKLKIKGQLTSSLNQLTSISLASFPHGTLNKTFSPLTLSSVSKLALKATLNKTLSSISLSSSNSASRVGSFSKTLSSVLLTSVSKLAIKATLSKTLTTISLASVGASTAVTYDTSIGNGVDTSGFAALPLRSTGSNLPRYFFVGNGGNDANDGLTHATRKASPATVAAIIQASATLDGQGCQMLLAEGSTFAEVLPTVAFMNGGYSLLYPYCIRSYDTTAPTDTSKYGRAHGTGSHARPQFTATNAGTKWGFTGTQSFIVVQGIDVNPGDLASQSIICENAGSGIMFENCLIRNGDIELSTNLGPTASHWIFRNNAIYGGWNTDPTNSTTALQGIYGSGCDSFTIEDNVLWHCGWRISTATRGDGTASGNAGQYSHAIYQQANESGCCVSRRNFIADIAADGGSHRSDALVTNNLNFNNPIAIGLGGGRAYDIKRPQGNALEASYNAIIGSVSMNSHTVPFSPAGWGLSTANGKNGFSLGHHNILAHGLEASGHSSFTYEVENDFPSTVSYFTADHNVNYHWMDSGNTLLLAENGFTGTCHFTGTNNYWDDPASGSNLNISSGTFPNPYDVDALCAAAGFTDKATAIAYAIANPEARIQRTILPLALAGYGIVPALQDLVMDAAFVTGTSNSGIIIGTVDGSVLTYSGFPANVTITNDTRTWRDDGTATIAASGTGTITETHPTLGVRTTNVPWVTYLASKLTSTTATSITATTATIGVTTDTGSGTLYYIISTSSISPHQAEVELHHDQNTTDYPKFGNQAISSTGSKTAALTGLTTATTYYVYWVQTITTGGRKVYSLVANKSFTTS